jgi:hypothetical protein
MVLDFESHLNLLLIIDSFRNPSLFYLLVHSRCRGILVSLAHTQTHTTVGRTPLDEGSSRRRDLYLTTQTPQETSIHAPLGIRTHDPSKVLGRRPMPQTARSLGSAFKTTVLCINLLITALTYEGYKLNLNFLRLRNSDAEISCYPGHEYREWIGLPIFGYEESQSTVN